MLYGRVSAQSQKDNQPDDLAILKMEVEKRDVPVIAVFWEIVPGWEEMYSDKWSRLEFERAILKAKAAGAVIAAASVDRFRRSWDPDWKKRKRQRRLSVFEIESLMTAATTEVRLKLWRRWEGDRSIHKRFAIRLTIKA